MKDAPVLPGEVIALSRSMDFCIDPVELFVRLTGDGLRKDTLILESGDTTTRHGYKSLLFTRCALRARCFGQDVEVTALNPNGLSLLPWLAERLESQAELTRSDFSLTVRYASIPAGHEQERLHAPSPIDVLRLMARGPSLRSCQPGLGPLVAGVFSYDLLEIYERLSPAHKDTLGWPDFEFWLPDQMVELQHNQCKALLVSLVYGGKHATVVYNDAVTAVAGMTGEMDSMMGHEPGCSHTDARRQGRAEVDMDDHAYAQLVEKLKGHILAGDVFQVVPSRTFSTPCTRPIEAYRCLRKLNPSPYMFFINASQGVLLGASPETALRVYGRPARVEICPIAGTRPRARLPDGSLDPDLDSRLEAELRLDQKELAEHMMLVDLARNDVARVSRPGTRKVDRLLDVERYSHVMHLVSRVSGQLTDDLDGLGAYVATANMGTLVGAPKIMAADLLRKFELDRRGPYGGAVGYFTVDGHLDTSIVIRSAVVRDGLAQVRAGAGIVHDSDPMSEVEETRRKAEAVLRAIWESEEKPA